MSSIIYKNAAGGKTIKYIFFAIEMEDIPSEVDSEDTDNKSTGMIQ